MSYTLNQRVVSSSLLSSGTWQVTLGCGHTVMAKKGTNPPSTAQCRICGAGPIVTKKRQPPT